MELRIINMISTFCMVYLCMGCSDIAMPTNLEPEMSVPDVTEITRTSAKLSIEIENRGSGTFQYFHFLYSADGELESTTEDVLNPSGTIETEIMGLIPGRGYKVRGEGIKNNAVVTTEEVSFCTLPNDRPVVSDLSPVSYGPTGIIVKFEIVSDGGEPVSEAGCYVGLRDDNRLDKVLADDNHPDVGIHYVLIDGLKTLTDYVIYPFASNGSGETRGEAFYFTTGDAVSLNSAGDLEKLLKVDSVLKEPLAISGLMNGDDFRYLRQLANGFVKDIDITNVSIVEGGGSYDGSRFTENDIVTTGLFSECSSLESVKLPDHVKKIERNAFSHSSSIKSITIPADVVTLLPSFDCPALENLIVSAANPYFKDHDGVVFNADLTDMVWLPQGKSGSYSLPESVTEIKESAFTGSNIEYLILPPGLMDIGRYAFGGSMIRSIIIPDNIRNIREGVFQNCRQLKNVTLGKSTEFVGGYVFDNTDIESLTILAPFPPYASLETLVNNPGMAECAVLHVPKGCKPMYRNHSVWGLFNNIVEDK